MLWSHTKCDCDCWWLMVVGKQPNHKDHDQVLTTLFETARKCNVRLNYEKLQYKQTEAEFWGGNLYYKWTQTCTRKGPSYCQDACTKLQERGAIFYRNDQLFIKVFSKTLRTCPTNKGACKGQSCIQLGPGTSSSFQGSEKWNNYCTNTGILWSKENHCITNRC